MKMTDAEKLMLFMICDIYEKLKIDGQVDPEFVREAIFSGNHWAFEWKYPGIFESGDTPPEVVRETSDILEMWWMIEHSYGRLSKDDKERIEQQAKPYGRHVEFRGFDGNNECDHMGVARFLVEQLERFQHFNGRDFNAHMPTLDTYRRMMAVFRPIRANLGGDDLSADYIITILNERTHPSNRI